MNAGATVAIMVATQMAAADKKVMDTLRSLGATSPATAQFIPADAGCSEDSIVRLVRSDKLMQTMDGRFYINPAPPKKSNTTAWIVAGVILLVAALVLIPIVFLAARSGSSGVNL